MAREMGYDVNLLKDRMSQLRNRYNLEKRRIESTQQQYPKRIIKSAWPLYNHLTFLSDHIKGRRSYRKMRPKYSRNYRNVKNEEESDAASEAEYVEGEGGEDIQDSRYSSRPSNNENASESFSTNFCTMIHNDSKNQTMVAERLKNVELRSQRIDSGAEKFKAFGNFLTTSLIEMDEKDALRLIEKFTSQLVRSLLTESVVTTEKHNTPRQMNGDISNLSDNMNCIDID